MTIPASIRFNNPGAMWGKGNEIATKWGSTSSSILNDVLGQGNNIAVFPDKVHGAAAQFDLWRTSKNYKGKTLASAIHTWSGGNSSQAYVEFLIKHATGLTSVTVINDSLLNSPLGIAMMKAQAWNEAGQQYPMTDDEWKQAQDMVFNGSLAVPTNNGGPDLVKVGDTGVNVSKLQKLLGCKDTGTYLANSETEFALKLYQIRHELTPDGVCGQLTWDKLNSKISW
jgi:hypothetical protein